MPFRISFILVLMAGLFVSFLLMNNSSGAGFSQDRDRTGSPLSNNTCGGCHSGGNFGAGIRTELLDDTIPVNTYEPGKTYLVRVSLSRTGFPAAFGFQAVALTSSNSDAGTFGVAPGGTRVVQVNNRQYFEHSRPNSALSYVIAWTPDAALQDTVRLFASGIAANGNGSTSGDQALVSTPLILLPATTTAVKVPSLQALYFSPAGRTLQVLAKQSGEITLQVVDLSGRVWQQDKWYAHGSGPEKLIQLQVSSGGIYLLHWRQNQEQGVKKIFLP